MPVHRRLDVPVHRRPSHRPSDVPVPVSHRCPGHRPSRRRSLMCLDVSVDVPVAPQG